MEQQEEEKEVFVYENGITRDSNGRLLPGNVLNPKGRPKGKTIKERVIEWLEENPEDMRDFVKHFVKRNRELAWRMLEGNPANKTDVTSGGKPIPILGGISKEELDESNNNSGQEGQDS